MASTAAVSGLQSLIIFVVMGLVTLWFTNLMFRALDILYKPGVKKWIQDRPSLDFPDLDPELCPLNPQGQQSEACQNGKSKKQASKGGSGKKDMPLSFADDEYLKQLEEELMILKAMRGKVAPAAGGSLKTAPPPTEEKPPPLGLGEIKQMKKQRGADAFYGEALIRDKEIGENVETFNRDELAFENEPGKPDYCDSADFDSLSLGGGSCDEIEKGAEKDAYDFETGREEEVTDASEPATGETEHESGADEQEEDFSGITMTSSRDEF